MAIQEFAQFLGVQGLPTIVFFNKNEEFITRVPGFVKKDVLYPLLNYIDTKCYDKKISFEVYLNNKNFCSDKS